MGSRMDSAAPAPDVGDGDGGADGVSVDERCSKAVSSAITSETSWIDRLTPEEFAKLDAFDQEMVRDELEWRRRRVQQVEKEKSIAFAGTLALLAEGNALQPAEPVNDRTSPHGRGRSSARSKVAPQGQPVVDERHLPVFLVPADVAALLRTSVKAVYAKVERGQLAGVVRDGTRILFDRDVLLRSIHGRGR